MPYKREDFINDEIHKIVYVSPKNTAFQIYEGSFFAYVELNTKSKLPYNPKVYALLNYRDVYDDLTKKPPSKFIRPSPFHYRLNKELVKTRPPTTAEIAGLRVRGLI